MAAKISKYISAEGRPLTDLFKEKAEAVMRQRELEGKAETRLPLWPAQKAGFISGFISGGELGFNLGKNIDEMEKKADAEARAAQQELFSEQEKVSE